MSGAFTIWTRSLFALRVNLLYILLMALGAAAGAGYIVFIKGIGDWPTFQAVIMSVSNAWGLLLVVAFMGHGLVAVPRTLWRKANVSGRLRRLALDAPVLWDDYQEVEGQLRQLITIIFHVSAQVDLSNPLRPIVDLLLEKVG